MTADEPSRHLQPLIPEAAPDPGLKDATEQFQRRLIVNQLQQANGNWTAAAKVLKVDRANLTRLAKRLGVQFEKRIS